METTTDEGSRGDGPRAERGDGGQPAGPSGPAGGFVASFPGLDAWAEFRAEHAGWLAARSGDGPIYALPRQAITALEAPGTPMLSRDDARAELGLLDLCRATRAVGVLAGRAIAYPHLELGSQRGLNAATRAAIPEMGWTAAQRGALGPALDRADDVHARLKGVAGWLALDPTFGEEVAALVAARDGLPAAARPGFPLMRPPGPPDIASTPPASFARRLASFCDRWGLCGLATRDLPLPRGPLLPAPGGAVGPAPAAGVHLVIPPHYPLADGDDLLRLVREQQLHEAQRLGMGPAFAAVPNHLAYGRLLEVAHLEATIRSRYGRSSRVGTIVAAIAASLGLSTDRVVTLRKAIAACRRGRRARVAWLRTRSE